MSRTRAASASAASALLLVETLQRRFVDKLETLARDSQDPTNFREVEWLRDQGLHGGGTRLEVGDTALFDRGSVNVSQVHYDDDPARKLGSATALSTIIHPRNPLAPSVHIHISWTEMRKGPGHWRLMADLNPAIEDLEATEAFEKALEAASPEQYEYASEQGDRYFYIPALERHRGVTHYYLEGYATDDPQADESLARCVAEAALDTYVELLGRALGRPSDEEQRAVQLAYHTLYLFQVLTLDRGTSSGLLVHDQNDVGILGSLPSHVDRELLASWIERLEEPQNELLHDIVAALPEETPAPVTGEAKIKLANVVRQHFRAHPDALLQQASGDMLPPTVDNHR